MNVQIIQKRIKICMKITITVKKFICNKEILENI